MFGISLTHLYQSKSQQFLKAPGFGTLKRSVLKPPALLPAFISCLALCAIPAKGQEPHSLTLHQSIPAAQTVAARQKRPVLVMFTAEWSPASAQLRKHVLTDTDAISLLSACFECVLIDVDAHPDITNELHIQHVPSGCILDTNGKVITRFECPSSTALFIATVARQLPQTSTGAQIAGQSSSLENAISVTATTPEISADFSTAGTLLADGAATGPTTASESVSGIAAKVRGLSSFAMTESSLPEIVSQETVNQALSQDEIAQEKLSVTRFPSSEQPVAVQASVATNKQQTQQSRFQANADEPVSTTAPWHPAPEPSVVTEAAIPASIAAATKPWQPEVGHLHPETATPAATNQIASSLDTTPREIPIAPKGTGSSSLIDPKPEHAEPRSMAQSPWLPAAAGAAVASSTQSFNATATTPNQATPNQATASQQTVAKSEKNTESSSATSETVQQPINPLLAAIQKPFSAFSSQPEVQEKEQIVRKPVHATYASQAAATEDSEETPPQKTMPLGLEGYCPVALMETGSWVEGQARWGARHRGRTYLFSGLEQQQTFLSDPDRYSPALSGDDPVAAIDGGKTSPGQRRYGVTYQKRIYLFESPETRAAFAANPQRYTSRVLLAEQPSQSGGTVLR
jgi:thioredoxin-like negative regulator of GroEL/YHS domain-containing protein